MKSIYINNFINLQKISDIFIFIEDKILSETKKNEVFLQIAYFLFVKKDNSRTLYLLLSLFFCPLSFP